MDQTVAQIAGRLAVSMVFQVSDEQLVKKSVELARAIVAEVERTEPVADFKGMGGEYGSVFDRAKDAASPVLHGGERGGKTERSHVTRVEQKCAAVEDEIRMVCERKQVDWRDAASFIVRKHGMSGLRDGLSDLPTQRRPDFERRSDSGPINSWGDKREKS